MAHAELRSTITLAAALALVGCMKPNPYVERFGQADGESGGESENDAGSDGDRDDDDHPLPDWAGDDGQSCAPLDGLASACATCMSASCCAAANSCVNAEPCECLATCVLDGESPGGCKNQCGAKPQDVPELALLLACLDESCPDC